MLFLLDKTAPGWDWVKDGGLLAVVAILSMVIFVLLKLYLKKDAQLEALATEFRQEVSKLLVDSIDARNETANSIREQAQSINESISRLISVLNKEA